MQNKRMFFVVVALVLVTGLVYGNPLEAKVLRAASVLPENNPSVVALFKFAEIVKERTNGELDVQVFPSSQLGGLRDTMEGCKLGLIDITYTNAGPAAQFVPSLNVTSLPYIFKSKEHMLNALNGEAGKRLVEDINKSGFVFLAWYDGGSRNIITNKRGVTKPEDMKGLKIRVMPSNQMVNTINYMGGIATPMEQGEVYNALQQGVLDGWENSPVTLYTLKLYEVSEYFSWTSHFRVPDLVFMSKKVFETLTPEQQTIMLEAGKELQEIQWQLWDEYYTSVVDELKKVGVEFTEIDDLTPFVEAVQPVWDEYKQQYGDELLNLIVNAE